MSRRRSSAASRDERGFTLIEMVVSIGLGAFIFAALGVVLAGGLKQLGVQKTRAQANEIATQAIEDLQRLDEEYVGICSAPSAPRPTGLTDTVVLPNCANQDLFDPCGNDPTGDVPRTEYACRRLNTDYAVKRDVAWADVARSQKRLGVSVSWTDTAGTHQVTQHSERHLLRPPTVTAVTVDTDPPSAGIISVSSGGVLDFPLKLSATTTGLTASDSVKARFTYRDPGNIPRAAVVSLTTLDGGANWSTTLATNQFKFPAGKQFFTFTAIRSSGDKKEGGRLSTVKGFCPPGGCDATVASLQTTTVPASADVDSAGVLQANVNVTATTQNLSSTDSVTMAFETLSGVRTIALTNTGCTAGTCSWQGSITTADARQKAFRFAGGPATFHFAAVQVVTNGTTAAATSTAVAFQ